jgi:oligoribonuclease NrnB/cAMP/cGMP phosphodiesterase (DHH superfamily)
MTRLLCLYHAQCDDGFGAAWAVRHAFKSSLNPMSSFDGIDFLAVTHAGKVPDVRGRMVLIVDFCFPAPVMDRMMAECDTMILLDHHKSSMLDMLEWAKPLRHVIVASQNDGRLVSLTTSKAKLLFDMDRSGARMAWDHFHTDGVGDIEKTPKFIDYIMDQDLWLKKVPKGDEFTAGLRSYPMDFDVWDELWSEFAMRRVMDEGSHILRYKRQLVEIAVKNSFWVELDVPAGRRLIGEGDDDKSVTHKTIRVRGANVPPAISSEVGEELALRYGGIGLTWCEGYKWIYSLRSRKVGDQPAQDVSLIAKAMGGGGHAQASGFKTMTPVHRKWRAPDAEAEEDA